jgi:hypothetical protein
MDKKNHLDFVLMIQRLSVLSKEEARAWICLPSSAASFTLPKIILTSRTFWNWNRRNQSTTMTYWDSNRAVIKEKFPGLLKQLNKPWHEGDIRIETAASGDPTLIISRRDPKTVMVCQLRLPEQPRGGH